MEIPEIKRQLTIRNILSYYGIPTHKHRYVCCPFHQSDNEKKQSMTVNDKSNTVYCFSSKCKCGMKQIDVIDFILYKENTDKHNAILKATQLITEGFIGECNNVAIKQYNNENNIIKLANHQIIKLHKNKLQYETDTLIYFILGGLPKTYDSLKVTLQINNKRERTDYSYRTKTDLYEYKQVEKTAKEIAEKLNVNANEVEKDLMRLADLLDKYRDENTKEEEPKTPIKPTLTEAEQKKCLAFLKQDNLIKEINKLLGSCGIIGEENNRIFLFGIAVSYKMEDTLHALIQGSSGSGKTTLLNKIMRCMPEEDVINVTRITENSLYNFGEYDLSNKLLSIEDMEGLDEKALFAFRELQSKEILISSTSAKTENGNIKSVIRIVRGPIGSMCATTLGEIYEDNMSRVFLLAVDESREQTNRIIEYQNKKASGEIDKKQEQKTQIFLQNCVRLLSSYEVVNPYANKIKLPETAHKIRRLNELYQSYVKQITLINQYQREKNKDGKLIAEKQDLQTACEIMFESIVLKVDELDGSLRQFFEQIKKHIKDKNREFTQREIRQQLSISKAQIHRYIQTLIELEYIGITGGHANKGYQYKVSYWDNYEALRSKIKQELQQQIDEL